MSEALHGHDGMHGTCDWVASIAPHCPVCACVFRAGSPSTDIYLKLHSYILPAAFFSIQAHAECLRHFRKLYMLPHTRAGKS